MDDYMLFAAGVAMAAMVFIALREMSDSGSAILPSHSGRQPSMNREEGFRAARGEVFEPKVAVLEFDEMGPGLIVNGEYHNQDERIRVDVVAADVSAGGGEAELISGDEEDPNLQEDKRIGDLVNLTGPTWLEEDQYGMFRAPLRDGEMEELTADILDKIDKQAELTVSKLDSDFSEGYLLDDESVKKLAGEFVAGPQVRGLLEELERLFIWKTGNVAVTVWFLDPEEGVIDEVQISLYLREEDSQSLRNNIRIMAVNSFLSELGMDLLEYKTVVLENSGYLGR